MKPHRELTHVVRSELRDGKSSGAGKVADPRPIQRLGKTSLRYFLRLRLLQKELAPYLLGTKDCFQSQGYAVVV